MRELYEELTDYIPLTKEQIIVLVREGTEKMFHNIWLLSILLKITLNQQILKQLTKIAYSYIQNTHYIDVNLLQQTTYYKLNTTRP